MALPAEEQIRDALKSVIDPEIHVDILNLGLIYGIDRNEETGHVNVRMTLTSPGCPFGPEIQRQTHMVVAALPEVKSVQVEITFSPPWDPRTMATDEAKDILGIF
ncbi:MAG: metal-sulfur cluster assembly factor [Deltaproteobacteria bacterium]|nr:metal-sulfur cluster assembly factor [Deltaproteobacteria bacterium]